MSYPIRNEPSVAILGGGASAAYIYSACRELGLHPDVYVVQTATSKGHAVTKGAFWLYEVPETVRNAFTAVPILMRGEGSSESYMSKQWSECFNEYPSSFPTEPKVSMGYSPSEVLPVLWKGVEELPIEPLDDEGVRELASTYHIVFQTFSSDADKVQYAKFRVTIPVLNFPCDGMVTPEITGFNAAHGRFLKKHAHLAECQNYVVYDGLFNDAFVRFSKLFDDYYMEFPSKFDLKDMYHYNNATSTYGTFQDIAPDMPSKPVLHSPAENVYLMGRYAEWERKLLTHQAYAKTFQILSQYGVKKHV